MYIQRQLSAAGMMKQVSILAPLVRFYVQSMKYCMWLRKLKIFSHLILQQSRLSGFFT